MPRPLSAENLQASQQSVVRPVNFIELHYDEGVSRFHTHNRTLQVFGHSFLGVGSALTLEGIQEQGDLQVSGVQGVLSAVAGNDVNQAIAQALNSTYQGRNAYIWLGYLDDNDQLVSEPTLIFSGLMDTQNIKLGKETSSITLTIENKLIDWSRPRNFRLNNETIQHLNAGDKGAEFVAQAAEKAIYWGKEVKR